jgi:uncharacterized coiled-coil DUF342 family protein
MAVDERSRSDAIRDLADAIGERSARTVIEMIDQPRPDPGAHDQLLELREQIGAVADQLRQLSEQVGELSLRMNRKFDRVDERFDRVDERFDRVDERFDRVDERFADAREHVDVRIDAVRHELTATFESGLRQAVVSQTRIIVFALVAAFAAVSGVAIGIGG